MSCYSLKFNVWTKGEAVRVYINSAHVEHRHQYFLADGAFFFRGENGKVDWSHGFRTGPDTIGRAERVAIGVKYLIKSLGLDAITFDELLARIEASKTKQGNFSLRRFAKVEG